MSEQGNQTKDEHKTEQTKGEDHTASEHSIETSHTDYEYEGGEDGEHYVKKEILDAALPFVHSHGWSQEAIVQGAEMLGYSGMAHGLFPSGGVELVNHFYQQCNTKLDDILADRVKEIENKPELKKGTTAFIGEAVEERLRMNIEYIDSWHKALALHAMPTNTLQAFKNLGTLVDTIWYQAGDRSHDFNWYTKRGLLAAVYKSTELCLLQDKSEDFQNTWAFMNRRLSDVVTLGKCARTVDGCIQNAGSFAKAGIATGLNIIGLNKKSR